MIKNYELKIYNLKNRIKNEFKRKKLNYEKVVAYYCSGFSELSFPKNEIESNLNAKN